MLLEGHDTGQRDGRELGALAAELPGEFRPAPPPACDSPELLAEKEAVRTFPRTFITNYKAFYWQSPEGLASRPYRYPSNHSTFSATRSEILAYLFPKHAAFVRALGKEAGDSRIWAGIHYQVDNVAGVQLGRSVAQVFIDWVESDGTRFENGLSQGGVSAHAHMVVRLPARGGVRPGSAGDRRRPGPATGPDGGGVPRDPGKEAAFLQATARFGPAFEKLMASGDVLNWGVGSAMLHRPGGGRLLPVVHGEGHGRRRARRERAGGAGGGGREGGQGRPRRRQARPEARLRELALDLRRRQAQGRSLPRGDRGVRKADATRRQALPPGSPGSAPCPEREGTRRRRGRSTGSPSTRVSWPRVLSAATASPPRS